MLGRVTCAATLIIVGSGCTVVSCPENMTCVLKPTNVPSAGTGGTSDAPDGGGDAGTLDDGGTIVDDGSNGSPDLPAGEWVNVTGGLAGKPSGCGNLDTVFLKPKSFELIAGILSQGLWSSPAGKTWKALGTGAGSATVTNGPLTIVFDPTDPNRFWEAGIYGVTGGLYTTTDGGTTFTALNQTYSDSIAVDFTDPKRLRMLAGLHELQQAVFKSTDGGATWANVGATLPKDRFCTVVLTLDATNYLVGCSGAKTGIFRTSDGAKKWLQVSDGGGALRPLVASDGSIYWSSAANGQLVRSTDAGQTWSEVMPANVLTTASPIELPDGRIAALSREYLVVSANHGLTWDYASAKLPYLGSAGVVYSPTEKAFFIWRNDCGNAVLEDAVMRFDFDYETQ